MRPRLLALVAASANEDSKQDPGAGASISGGVPGQKCSHAANAAFPIPVLIWENKSEASGRDLWHPAETEQVTPLPFDLHLICLLHGGEELTRAWAGRAHHSHESPPPQDAFI